jgi:NADPH:quinone reductase-like Zn-dependent oxidoreductase
MLAVVLEEAKVEVGGEKVHALTLQRLPTPSATGPDDCVVRITHASLNRREHWCVVPPRWRVIRTPH